MTLIKVISVGIDLLIFGKRRHNWYFKKEKEKGEIRLIIITNRNVEQFQK
jgi:hypothetical protein